MADYSAEKCASCGAPLPEDGDVVKCTFCGTLNRKAIEPLEFEPHGEEYHGPIGESGHPKRNLFITVSAMGIVAILALTFLVPVIFPPPPPPPTTTNCDTPLSFVNNFGTTTFTIGMGYTSAYDIICVPPLTSDFVAGTVKDVMTNATIAGAGLTLFYGTSTLGELTTAANGQFNFTLGQEYPLDSLTLKVAGPATEYIPVASPNGVYYTTQG